MIHVVANNTLVESPPVGGHISDSIADIQHAANVFNLTITTMITHPKPDQSYWVNLIGRVWPVKISKS